MSFAITTLYLDYLSDRFIEKLRQVPLVGYNGHLVWKTAKIAPREIPMHDLVPAQRYVLKDRIEQIQDLNRRLAVCHPFRLPPYVEVGTLQSCPTTEVVKKFPFTWPIVQNDPDLPEGKYIVVDGMHRILAKHSAYSNPLVQCIVIEQEEVATYPYYAYPLAGWDEVEIVDEIPDVKKFYRKEDYKSLFRDLNSIFPGIQESRKKKKDAPPSI